MAEPTIERPLTADALDAVSEEVDRARAKFPGNEHLYVALGEELGELGEALLNDDGSAEAWWRIRDEAMQVACVAVRIMTEGDGDFPCGRP